MPGWFSPVSSISTGLLFGVSLLHLIPDCTTDMQNALERNGFQLKLISRRLNACVHENWIPISANVKNVYPVTMLLISTGFFIVTLVEILVSRCRKNKEVLTERLKASSMHHQPEAQCQTWHFNLDGIGSSINSIWWISNDRKPNWFFRKVRKSCLYNAVRTFCAFNFWRPCYWIARRQFKTMASSWNRKWANL